MLWNFHEVPGFTSFLRTGFFIYFEQIHTTQCTKSYISKGYQ